MRLAQVGDVLIGDSRWVDGDNFAQAEDDPSRIGAQYVVVSAGLAGAGYAHGPGDHYPNGHQVTCRRLAEGGNFEQTGERLMFYQTGCFTCMIEDPHFSNRKLRMTFEEAPDA